MIETDRQLAIKKQFIKGGGYARKQTNAYTSGIPDLHAIAPGFAPVDIEVKDLGQILTKSGKFDRKVDTTRLQRDTMLEMNTASGQGWHPDTGLTRTSAFVMVTWKIGATIYVASIPHYQQCINSEDLICVTRLNELHLHLNSHLKSMGVPTI